MEKWFHESAWWDLCLGIIWAVVAAIYGYEYFCLHRYRSWIVMLPNAVGALFFGGLAIYKFVKNRKTKNNC